MCRRCCVDGSSRSERLKSSIDVRSFLWSKAAASYHGYYCLTTLTAAKVPRWRFLRSSYILQLSLLLS